MSFSLQIVRNPSGTWSVRGLPNEPASPLASLADSVAYARRECASAPATIELIAGGFYAVIHQELGWPRRVVAPMRAGPQIAALPQPEPRGMSSRFCDWFKRWSRAAADAQPRH